MVNHLVICEVPGEGTYVQAACSSRKEAEMELRKLGGKHSSNYSIVEYDPDSYVD